MESATALIDDDRREAGPRVTPAAGRREPIAVPVMRLESLGIFLAFGLLYTLVGLWVLTDLHVVNFDALDRLTRAFMVWYNEPQKLAAIGFALPPISTLALVPFAAVRELVTSGLALPLSSAIFAAGALTFINRMFAVAEMARPARLMIVLLVGLNPMFAYYAMNGTGDAAYMFFLAAGLFCLIAWGRNESARYLIGAGLAFALAGLTKYELLIWAFVVAFVISWTLSNRGREKAEIEGSTLAYFAPVAYALALWIFFNGLVLGDPFAWISLGSDAAPVNAAGSAAPGFDLAEAFGNALQIELIFPATILVALALLLNVGRSRDTISIGIAMLIVLSIAYSVIGAAVAGSVDSIELHDGLPGMVAGIAGIAYLYLKATGMRPMIWAISIALAVIALPVAWAEMKDYPHQTLEQAFTRAIATGDDQEGTSSRGGYVVGIGPERAIADFIKEEDVAKASILTDDARTYGVITLSGDPSLFFDRVSEGDAVWQDILDDPVGKVGYMLVERSDSDLIFAEYPGALEGEVPFLDPIVLNDRYALLRVFEDEAAPPPTALPTDEATEAPTAPDPATPTTPTLP